MSANNDVVRIDSATPTHGKLTANGQTIKRSAEHTATSGKVKESSKTINGGPAYKKAGAPNWKGPQQDNSGTAANGDPFDKGIKAIKNGILSGEATTFSPGSSKPAPISFLNRNSEADDGPVIVSSSCKPQAADKVDKGKGKAVMEPIGTRGENFSPTRPRVHFTTDVGPDVTWPGGHYMKIENVSGRDMPSTFDELYNNFDWTNKVLGASVPPPVGNSNYTDVFFSFDDIRDAAQAEGDLEVVNPNWSIVYMSQTEYVSGRKGGTGSQEKSSFHDGQLVLVAQFKGLNSEQTLDGVFNMITTLAKDFGEVIGVREMDVDGGNRQYRVEYYKISAAKRVISRMTEESPAKLGKWEVVAKEVPDYARQTSPKNEMTANATPQKIIHDGQVFYASPTGRTAWTKNEKGEEVPVPGLRSVPKCNNAVVPYNANMTPNTRYGRNTNFSPYTPANNFYPNNGSCSGAYHSNGGPSVQSRRRTDSDPFGHGVNRIRRDRVLNGQDVRTTIMLRNFPKGMTADLMKSILDTTSAGKYDFSYCRMDFQKSDTIGYGFVNFTDALDILHFYDHWVGRAWLSDLSQPVTDWGVPRMAEIAYATVQGYDCVVEKFRNSAIMKEWKGFRPMLWYTVDTAPDPSMIGAQKEFPGVNNPSKHQRSVDNATSQGLFPARGRRTNNGGQVRRSQYDRGTTHQIQEDAYYNQMSPMQNGYGFNQSNYQLAPGPMPMPIGPPSQYPPMHYGNGHPNMNGSPAMNANGYGYPQFTYPVHAANAAGPSAPSRHMGAITGNGRQGRYPNISPQMAQMAQDEYNRRYDQIVAIQAAYDRAQANAVAPRVMDAEENEDGNVANYSSYTAYNQRNANGGHAANGYGYPYGQY